MTEPLPWHRDCAKEISQDWIKSQCSKGPDCGLCEEAPEGIAALIAERDPGETNIYEMNVGEMRALRQQVEALQKEQDASTSLFTALTLSRERFRTQVEALTKERDALRVALENIAVAPCLLAMLGESPKSGFVEGPDGDLEPCGCPGCRAREALALENIAESRSHFTVTFSSTTSREFEKGAPKE